MLEVPFAPKIYIDPDSIGKSAAEKIAKALALSKKKPIQRSETIEKAKLKVSLETLTARQAALIDQAPSDLSGYLAGKDLKALGSEQLTLEITDFQSLSASLKESAIQSIQGHEDVK